METRRITEAPEKMQLLVETVEEEGGRIALYLTADGRLIAKRYAGERVGSAWSLVSS
jgi:hypothetical protein